MLTWGDPPNEHEIKLEEKKTVPSHTVIPELSGEEKIGATNRAEGGRIDRKNFGSVKLTSARSNSLNRLLELVERWLQSTLARTDERADN